MNTTFWESNNKIGLKLLESLRSQSPLPKGRGFRGNTQGLLVD